MNKLNYLLVIFFCLAGTKLYCQDWTHYVRAAGHPCVLNALGRVMDDARKTKLFGIEVDNDITGRYESFLDPQTKLTAIKAMADSAHAAKNYAFVYIAGLECITGNAKNSTSSFFKDHPDWVQRNKKGEPAMFGGGAAFWIDANDEDVWISPYATEWRKQYMERVRQIAATGIDGIYVDIPYWMTHFTGWEDTWASFDQYTVAEFKKRTGIDAMTEVDLGNYDDPHFIAWIDFRMNTLTEFMAEIDKNIKSVNPACKTIAEIYPSIGEEAVRVGADVYSLYNVVDVIAHEYNPGGNSARRDPDKWLEYMTNMFTFRAFAQDKSSWMLSYSWDKDSVSPADAMQNLAMSQVMAGTNTWDASRFVMGGSNDYSTRTKINTWIKENQDIIYSSRKPMAPVSVYFSPVSRNYFTDGTVNAYWGVMDLMLLNHIETEVVTPETLAAASGKVIILPNVKCLGEKEISELETLLQHGRTIIFTGETGLYNDKRELNKGGSSISALIGKYPRAILIKGTPEINFHKTVTTRYNALKNHRQTLLQKGDSIMELLNTVKNDESFKPSVKVENAAGCVVQIASVQQHPTVFIANFLGLKGKQKAVQIPADHMVITFNHVKQHARARVIPFMGMPKEINGQWRNGALTVTLPPVLRGAIVSLIEE